MKRDILNDFALWRSHPYRKPLILRGARQVGKSWAVKEFSKQFEHFVSINFESAQSAHEIFAGDLNTAIILEKLAFYTHQKIIPGKTLLFFDEVQECPNALLSLRYFKEECPELHIIAAGSLIDFVLHEIGMPVGRVQFMYLYPMSFGEFLTVNDREDLRQYILTQAVDAVTHKNLLEYLKVYYWLGGMPAVVEAWLNNRDPVLCHEIHDEIIDAYQQDFHKYATDRQIPYLSKTFMGIPRQIGRKFKFAAIDADVHSLPLKQALMLLNKAGVASYCYHTSAHRLPLGADINEKKFKVFFFDIGLAQRILGLDTREWLLTPMTVANIGPIIEQLVAQELTAYTAARRKSALYYWHRESRGSNAEVDFVVQKNNDIIPVEVKSAKDGRMRSLHLYLESHPGSPYGLKIAEHLFSQHGNIKEIPLYAIEGFLNQPILE
jgi:predicted AAA+ superfamily ATPase